MNWSTREHGSWQESWSPTWPRSPLVVNPVQARHSLRSGAVFRAPKTVPRKVHHDVKGTSLVLPCTQRHAEFEVALRGCSRMPTMIIPGFTLRHARTVASCASSSVKSHVSSNKATPRKGCVVQTLLTSRFSWCILDWSSIILSMARRTRRGTDFVGWDSSTIQLKNPSGTLKDNATCSPDSTFCLGTSPRVVIWFLGRCPIS